MATNVPTFCVTCCDEMSDSGRDHKNVMNCVPLCNFCGGLMERDERYELQPDDQCQCPR